MKTLFTYRFYLLTGVVLLLLGLGNKVEGAPRTASVTGNWSNTATWGGQAVPVAGDNIIINSGITVTVNVTTAAVTTIVINAAGTANGITISGSNILNCGVITMNLPSAAVNSTIAVGAGTLNATSIAIPGSGTAGRNCIVSVSTGTINFTGGVTFSGTAAQAQLTFTGAGTLNIGGNFGGGGTFTCSTGTVNFNGTSAQTFPGYTFNILKSNNAAGVTPTAAPTITTLTIADVTGGSVFNDGAFAISTATTLNLNSGKYNCKAASFPWATLNALTGTVDYSLSGTQTVAVKTYYNLILSGSGAKTFAVTTVNNNLTLEGTTTATTSAALTIGGKLDVGAGTTFATGTTNTWTLSVTGTTSVTGTLTLANTGTKSFTGDVTVNSGGVWNETGIAAITFGGSLSNNATTFTANSGTHTFSGATKTLGGSTTTSIANVAVTGTYTNSGTLTISTALSGAGSLTNGTTGTLNIGGTSAITTLVASAIGNTVNYTGAGQTIYSINYYNLILSGSGTETLQAGTTAIDGYLTLSGTVSVNQATNTNLTIGGNLTVGTNTSLTISDVSGLTPTFTVTGTTTVSGDLNLNHGYKTFTGDITVNNGGAFTKTDGLNNGFTFSGSITNNGTFEIKNYSTGLITFNGSGKIFSGTGTITVTNVTFSGASTSYTNSGTFTVASTLDGNPSPLNGSGGAIFTQATTGILNIGGAINQNNTAFKLDATTNAGNTVNYTGNSQTIKPINYHNLTLSGSGTDVLQTGTTSIGGDFTLSGTVTTTAATGLTIGGAVSLGSGTSFTASSFTHNLAGDWINNGGTFTNTGSTINFNGTGAQSIGGSASNTFNHLTISNTGGTCTAGSALTVGGTLTTNTGTTLDMGTNALTVNTVAHSGTLKTQNTSSTPITATKTWGGTVEYNGSLGQTIINGNYNNLNGTGGSRILNSSGIIGVAGTFTPGAGTYTISGSTIDFNGAGSQSIPAFTYNNLNTSTGGTKTLNGAVAVNNVLTVGASSTIDLSSQTLTLAGNGTPLVNSGTFTPSTSTVNYSNSASTNITALNYYNLNGSGGARVLPYSGTVGIANTFTPGAGDYTTTGSTIDFNGTGTQTVNGFNYNNLTISNTGATCTAGGAITANGTFTTSSGATLDMATNALSVSTAAHSGTLKTQNTTSPPFSTGKSWGGTVNLNAATAGQTIPAGTYGILTLGNTSGTQSAGGNLTVTTLNNNTNAADILDMGTSALAVTTVNNSGTIKTQNTSPTPLSTGKTWGGKVQYDAASGQTVVAGTYEDLTLCTSGEKTLGTTTINGILSLEGTATIAGNTPSYGTEATIQYKGSAAQTTGIELPATFSGTGGVIIDNGSGVTLEGGTLKTIAAGSNLTVTSGKLTIPYNGQLTVAGTLANTSAAGLHLESTTAGTASLINSSASVKATIDRYITGHDSAWHFLSTPVSDQAISGTWLPEGTPPAAYGNGTKYDLYVWNEPTNCWIYKLNTTATANWNTVHPGTNFVPGRGYLYSVLETNPTKTFAGTLNTGILNFAITSTTVTPENTYKGFNLVGNPYPSSIDWQSATGWDRSKLTTIAGGYDLYIFNPTSQNYGVFNSYTGVGTHSVTRYIAPMQGFFVRAANSGNLGFSDAIRVHDATTNWKSAQFNPNAISAIVTSEADQSCDEVQMLFGYPTNQTGAAKLFSPVATAPSLYLPAGDANFTVRYLTDTVASPAVPVQFKPGRDGDYTLSFNFDESTFKTVLLEDRLLKVLHDLRSDPTYRFRAAATDQVNRFILHLTPVRELTREELPARIFTDGEKIRIDLTAVTGETTVCVYDLLGRKRYDRRLTGETQHTLNFNPGTQPLIIQLKNPQGSLCRKILCNNTSQ